MVWVVVSQIAHFSIVKSFAIGVIFIFMFSFLRIRSAICLFIFLAPFHYVLKELYPSLVTDLWREGFFLSILLSWFIQVFLTKRLPIPPKSILNPLIIVYMFWGAIEILRSFNLLVGLAGFRFMFAFVPLYFVTLSTIEGEKEIKKYVNVILISGFIIAIIAIVQVVVVSILGIIKPGGFLSVLLRLRYSGARPAGWEFHRVTSVFASPNELGIFLVTCLIIIIMFSYSSPKYKMGHPRKMFFPIIIIMVVALLFSMSRSSGIGFIAAILALSFLRKKRKPLLVFISTMVVLFILLSVPSLFKALFGPVFTLSDPYFEGLRSDEFWSVFWQSPLMGHGFSITLSSAIKLRISEFGLTPVGSTDNYFLQSSMQIGVIGFFLHFLIWLFFLRNSYFGTKNAFLSEAHKAISTAIFGILIALMVASLHTSPWEYVSLSGTYYVVGAISTFVYHEAKKKRLESIETGGLGAER